MTVTINGNLANSISLNKGMGNYWVTEMNRFLLGTAPLFLLLVWFLAFASGAARAADPAAGQELMLIYSNDVNGETEPCG
jgi:hypothetical protein